MIAFTCTVALSGQTTLNTFDKSENAENVICSDSFNDEDRFGVGVISKNCKNCKNLGRK